MAELSPGQVINSAYGSPIKVIKELGRGGQGIVYLVEYNGKQKALKWYHAGVLNDPKAFYENLKNNVNRTAPDKIFLWPETITEIKDGVFGYLMDLRPPEYVELAEILASSDKNISSFRAAVEACIQITVAFMKLHNIGYSYQDLNDGNFFINLKTGDTLICDNDNVAPNGKATGILGKIGYMAPEIVLGNGKVLPDQNTDRHSLAAIIFAILLTNNPLEGKRYFSAPVMSKEIQYDIYGEHPIFMFDPHTEINRPNPKFQKHTIDIWNCFPKYMKDAFVSALGQEALKKPQARMREAEWMNVLCRFRSDIVTCPKCKNGTFLQNSSSTKCDRCGYTIPIMHQIKLPKYVMAVSRGARIYRCQLGVCNDSEVLEPVGAVVSKPGDPSVLGYMNMVNKILTVITPSGKRTSVSPRGIVPFNKGLVIEAFDKKIEFI